MFRERSLKLVNHWNDILANDSKIWDQTVFNSLARYEIRRRPNDPLHYVQIYNQTLLLGILPVALFCSGHTYFVSRMYETTGLQPYSVHATFQYSGNQGFFLQLLSDRFHGK